MRNFIAVVCCAVIAIAITPFVRDNIAPFFADNLYAMVALIVAAIIGHQLGQRRVLRLEGERHGPAYVRRLLKISTALYFGLKTRQRQRRYFFCAFPLYVLFLGWQNWRRYRAA